LDKGVVNAFGFSWMRELHLFAPEFTPLNPRVVFLTRVGHHRVGDVCVVFLYMLIVYGEFVE